MAVNAQADALVLTYCQIVERCHRETGMQTDWGYKPALTRIMPLGKHSEGRLSRRV